MNATVLRVELKRSVAPWAGAVALASALAFLCLLNGEWQGGTTAWTAQWTTLALWTRYPTAYLWPLAVGLGALQGLRDHRSKIADLLTSTPRPARHRAAATAGALALTLASAFALVVLVGAVQVVADTQYTQFGWLPISLIGALFLVAGAVLGMGAGRALPSVLTPPAVAVGAFVFTNLMHMAPWGQKETFTAAGFPSTEPRQLSLLSPTVPEVHRAFVTLSASVHVGQLIWLLGMAATGFALLVAATPKTRLIALTPVLAGAALALLVLPSDPRRMYVVDKAATHLVCDGPVCVTRTQQARLADLAGPGEEALRLMHSALGDQAPVSVQEDATVLPDGTMPQWSRETVFFTFDDDMIATAKGDELTRALIAEGTVPGCVPVGTSGFAVDDAVARNVAVGWVLGGLQPIPGAQAELLAAEVDDKTRQVWKDLRALPRAEQLSRIDAMRAAALSCTGDALKALTGGTSQ